MMKLVVTKLIKVWLILLKSRVEGIKSSLVSRTILQFWFRNNPKKKTLPTIERAEGSGDTIWDDSQRKFSHGLKHEANVWHFGMLFVCDQRSYQYRALERMPLFELSFKAWNKDIWDNDKHNTINPCLLRNFLPNSELKTMASLIANSSVMKDCRILRNSKPSPYFLFSIVETIIASSFPLPWASSELLLLFTLPASS